MNVKNLIPLLAVAIIVVAAGCTSKNPSTISTNDGVVINSFESDDSTLNSGETTNLYLEIQNVGGVDSDGVMAYLFGADGWNPRPSATVNVGKLEAPKYDVPSSPRNVMWTVTAPQLPEGVKQPFTMTARVVYHYKSNAAGKINVYSDEEWRRRNAKQPISPSSIVPVKNSPGPIHVSIQGPTDVKLSSYTDGIPILIKISNTGSGFPIKNIGDWDRPTLSGTIRVVGSGQISCYKDGNSIGRSSSVQLNDMDMRYNKPKSISCTLYPDLQGTPYEPVTIALSFDYNYYVQKQLQINVIGTKSGGSSNNNGGNNNNNGGNDHW